MEKNKTLSSFAGLFLMSCCALVCLASAVAGIPIYTAFSLPVYKMEQVDSIHTGYRRTTITSGNTVYVHDYEEYALTSINSAPNEKIGRIEFSIFGAYGLYAIPGVDPSEYALEFDPMYQVVYRNIEHPPFDWRNAEFQRIRLSYQEPINPKESEDPLLIDEILSALKSGTPTIVPIQTDGNYSDTRNYNVILFSDQLPGLMYFAAAHETTSGEVFLAENAISNEWMPAGPLFAKFIKDTP